MIPQNLEKQVFLVGPTPPPSGGISIHVDRLARLLVESGRRVTVFDPTGETKTGSNEYTLISGNPMAVFTRLIAAAFVRPRSILHCHVSCGSKAVWLMPLLAALALKHGLILTVHSGSLPARLQNAKWPYRPLLSLGLKRSKAVIVVSEALAEALRPLCGKNPSKIMVIPAFLQPPVPAQPAKNGVARRLSAARRPAFLASGYGTNTYFWEGLIEALNKATHVGEFHFAFYHHYERPYFDEILARIRGLDRFPCIMHRDLTPAEFQTLLRDVDVFVRPTRTDGDSVALREALALGKQVIASDAVPRPAGCVLHRNENVEDLASKINEAHCGTPAAADTFDPSQQYLDLYARL